MRFSRRIVVCDLNFMWICLLYGVMCLLLCCDGFDQDFDLNLEELNEIQMQELNVRLSNRLDLLSKQVEDAKDQEFDVVAETSAMDLKAEQIKGARNWETDEKRKRLLELSQLERAVLEKQLALSEAYENVTQLRESLSVLKEKHQVLENDTTILSRHMKDPRIVDALEENSDLFGEAGQLLINETVHEVVPELEELHQAAIRTRQRFPPIVVAFGALLLYSLAIFVCFSLISMYRLHIRGSLSVSGFLLFIDALCAGSFGAGSILAALLGEDPMSILYRHSRSLFLLWLIVNLGLLGSVVLVRICVLSMQLGFTEFGETFICIITAHHYYSCVWHRALLIRVMRDTYSYYLLYSILFALLMSRRIEPHHTQKLSLFLHSISQPMLRLFPQNTLANIESSFKRILSTNEKHLSTP